MGKDRMGEEREIEKAKGLGKKKTSMNDMRYVYDISRKQAQRSKALAKAKNRQAQRQAERR